MDREKIIISISWKKLNLKKKMHNNNNSFICVYKMKGEKAITKIIVISISSIKYISTHN